MPAILAGADAKMEAPAPIDSAELRDRLQGDAQLLSELAAIFRGDVPEQIEKIRGAISRDDAGGGEMAANLLKGAAAVLFARPSTDAARQLEMMGRAGKLKWARRDLEILQKEWERLKPFVNELCLEVQKS